MKISLEDEYYKHILEGISFGTIKNIVFSLLHDITDRRGFSGQWDQIDDDVREETIQTWIDITTVELLKELPK